MEWRRPTRDVVENAAALAAVVSRSVPHFRNLCDYGDGKNINVLIENHGGPSSYPDALETLIAAVDHGRFGTLPDFGNFQVSPGQWYDRYQGVEELMPYAKAVSAKSHVFDDAGNETGTDYTRMMKIVLAAGYHGDVGIE